MRHYDVNLLFYLSSQKKNFKREIHSEINIDFSNSNLSSDEVQRLNVSGLIVKNFKRYNKNKFGILHFNFQKLY